MILRRLLVAGASLALALPAAAGEKTADSSEFAAAAEACIAALAPPSEIDAALTAAGWNEAGSNPIGKRYRHDGMSVAIVTSAMLGSPSCVVDGYLAKKDRDGLDEAIEASLSATYGAQLTVSRSGPGTGFVIGDVIAILSFENRSGGLSTRITAMSMADTE